MNTEPASWRDLPNAPADGTAICTESELRDGECRLLQVGPAEGSFELLIMRSGDNWRAYANRCPHFGVGLAQRQEHLIYEAGVSLTCNVHYARFRWQDGHCERGDCAGDALLAIPVECRNGWVVIEAVRSA